MCRKIKLAKQWPHPWMTYLGIWMGFVELKTSKRFNIISTSPCCKNFFPLSSVTSADKVVMNTGSSLEYRKCPELVLRPRDNKWSPFKPEQLQSVGDDILIEAPIIQEGQPCLLQTHERKGAFGWRSRKHCVRTKDFQQWPEKERLSLVAM